MGVEKAQGGRRPRQGQDHHGGPRGGEGDAAEVHQGDQRRSRVLQLLPRNGERRPTPRRASRMPIPPRRNWAASAPVVFEKTGRLDSRRVAFGELVKHRVKKEACWHCPIACWGNGQGVLRRTRNRRAASAGVRDHRGVRPAVHERRSRGDLHFNDVCNAWGSTPSRRARSSRLLRVFRARDPDAEDAGFELRVGDGEAVVG